MGFEHGKDMAVSLDDTGGSAVSIAAYCNDSTLQRLREIADVTTFGKTSRARKAGLQDLSFSISGILDDTGAVEDLFNGAVDDGAERTLEVGIGGTGSGDQKITAEVLVSSFQITGNLTEGVGFSADMSVSDGNGWTSTNY